jgi:hypothetical protein
METKCINVKKFFTLFDLQFKRILMNNRLCAHARIRGKLLNV